MPFGHANSCRVSDLAFQGTGLFTLRPLSFQAVASTHKTNSASEASMLGTRPLDVGGKKQVRLVVAGAAAWAKAGGGLGGLKPHTLCRSPARFAFPPG